MLGLDAEWAYRIVKQVGNYAESVDRNIKPLGIERGVNRLWRDGGVHVRAHAAVIAATRTAPPMSIRSRFSWSAPRTRAIVWQIVAWWPSVVAVARSHRLADRDQPAARAASGQDSTFSTVQPASKSLGGLVEFSSRDTYARALLVGLLNTLRVSLLGIAAGDRAGSWRAVWRASRSVWVVSTIARGYVELMRNTPLLLQLLFWYSLSQALPGSARGAEPLAGCVSLLPWVVPARP